jgi:hypothetical protein
MVHGANIALVSNLYSKKVLPYSAQMHSKLRNIMLVATKVHVILRSYVVLTCMCDKRESL